MAILNLYTDLTDFTGLEAFFFSRRTSSKAAASIRDRYPGFSDSDRAFKLSRQNC
jgi:hypothetical protein